MSKKNSVRLAFMPFAVMAVACMATCALGVEASGEAARLDSFADSSGTNYFALSLDPTVSVAEVEDREIVVLFDTSASQTGEFRDKALDSLKTLFANLGDGAKVRLIAVDLNAVALTDGFVAVESEEMAKALKTLDGRVPLGATDMEKAIDAVVDNFKDPAGKTARVAIYIGDGKSMVNLLGMKQFAGLVQKLTDARIPVSAYAIGPDVDTQLLGALVCQTGGLMIVGSDDLDGKTAGDALAAATLAPVFWPTDVKLSKNITQVFPKKTPPLRSDRDMVLVGTFDGKGPLDITIDAATTGGRETMSWSVKATESKKENGYLVRLVEIAQADDGLSLPLAGSACLQGARNMADFGAVNFEQLARQSLAGGDLDGAARLADAALSNDPQSSVAKAVLEEVKAKRVAGGMPELNATGNTKVSAESSAAVQGAFAEAFEHDRKVIAQITTADVRNTISDARKIVSVDPDAAVQNLKLKLDTVKRAPELDPDVRDQLVDQLSAALKQCSARRVEVEQKRQEMHESQAAAKERMVISDNLARKQEKVKQLMVRFNSLMDEGRYVMARDEAAAEARKLAPENAATNMAVINAGMVGYEKMTQQVVEKSANGFLATMFQVRKSLVPFPDDEPIIFPDAEVWQRLSARRKEEYKSMDLASRGDAEKRINAELRKPTTVDFIETPLSDVVEFLKDLHGIEIQLDKKALSDVGVGSDTPISRNLKGVSLRSAMRLMLRDLDLTYVIENEVLLITTPEESESRLSTKVYPVADLVLPVRTPQAPGMMGSGGGGMGGMGGMMGGGGGGGMGGGGGGMGGGGMGGGGGMFNVPPGILNNMKPNPFRAFAVKDDLTLTPNGKARKPELIKVDVPDGTNAGDAWGQYFKNNTPTPAAVRESVRQLMQEKKYGQVVALINAALRNRQVQPWMYEAMALAMQADGRSIEDVERAVMSAVDFADNPASLMYVGMYLANIGANDRALQVFKQVAKIAPVRPEPYICGLKAARRINDLEGIKWATAGILGQAWSGDNMDVWKTGRRVAIATLEELKKQKKFKEAAEFEKTLDAAVVRDCVVVVSWTGDADVDLLVEEPSGTVCSFRTPRTTAGGVMLGDTSSHMAKDGSGGFKEVYVCPKGFSGTYRMLLRRVWGEVTAGKVTVDVYTNFRGKNQKKVTKRISLQDGEAVASFDMKNGRRKDSLKQHQIANAAAGQLAVRQHILAQQLAGAVDPTSMLSMSNSRSDEKRTLSDAGFLARGAVGYQPVIIVLPEGTNMTSTAVISADRRFVRVTSQPLFSGVAEVNTFNMYSGESGDGQGGTGGQGFSGM